MQDQFHSSDQDVFDDLLAAASSTLEFWDNPMDDEDWNCAVDDTEPWCLARNPKSKIENPKSS